MVLPNCLRTDASAEGNPSEPHASTPDENLNQDPRHCYQAQFLTVVVGQNYLAQKRKMVDTYTV
jgi:hypothetical protein